MRSFWICWNQVSRSLNTSKARKDQPRVEAENELKLQNHLNQFWQRIGRLEQHTQKSDAERAALDQRLQKAEQDKGILEDRVQKLENDKACTDRYSHELETNNALLKGRLKELREDCSTCTVSEQNITSPKTVNHSIRSTPNTVARDQDFELGLAFSILGLDPVKLHLMLPRVLFMLDVEKKKVSDGSEFPLSMISSLRSILKDTLADSGIDTKKLANLQEITAKGFSTKAICLQRYLQRSSISTKKSVWTKEYEHSYACRACVN
jgi:hypothetical protein